MRTLNRELFSTRRDGLLRLRDDGFDVQSQTLCHAGPIRWIGFVEVLDLQLLNALGYTVAQAGDDVVDQPLLGIRRHQAEEIPGLRVIVAVGAVIVPCDRSAHSARSFEVGTVL